LVISLEQDAAEMEPAFAIMLHKKFRSSIDSVEAGGSIKSRSATERVARLLSGRQRPI
jgi:hypothetical protein